MDAPLAILTVARLRAKYRPGVRVPEPSGDDILDLVGHELGDRLTLSDGSSLTDFPDGPTSTTWPASRSAMSSASSMSGGAS